MKKRLRVIIMGMSISFVIMALLSFFSMQQFETLINYSDQEEHTHQIIAQLFKLGSEIRDIDKTERGYMLTHDTIYSNGMYRHLDSVQPIIARIKDLTEDNPRQQKNLILLKSVWVDRIDNIKKNVSFLDTSRSKDPSSFYFAGREAMRTSMRLLKEMQDAENELLGKRLENKKLYQQITSSYIKYLLIVFCIVTIALFFFMIQELRKRLRYQEALRSKIMDLKRSHAELEQITYAVSHDLQEPVRKIQVFSNRLLWMKKDKLDEDSKSTMDKISASAGRMQDLIEDLVNLNSLTREDTRKETVDLNMIVRNVMGDLDTKIEEAKAKISFVALPKVQGNAEQLQALFKALLDNAIKFSKEGAAPDISIVGDVVYGDELIDISKGLARHKFCRISISDKGIGFDNKFAHKMFQIFQRLHNNQSQYAGKGIGLAISQRIMANHEGYITAHGHSEMGATFKLFFPLQS